MQENAIMRATTTSLTLATLLLTELLSPTFVQPAQPAPAQPAPRGGGPCAQITAACKQAGFVPKGAKTGLGIVVDCIRPIMMGTPQGVQGTNPLPQIDPQVVAACKQRNPNFGMGGRAKFFLLIGFLQGTQVPALLRPAIAKLPVSARQATGRPPPRALPWG
jgi:hypothetical protein